MHMVMYVILAIFMNMMVVRVAAAGALVFMLMIMTAVVMLVCGVFFHMLHFFTDKS